MALSQEEIRRRLRAGRELAGKSRDEVATAMEAEGFGRHDIKELEREVGSRGDQVKNPPRTIPFTPARRSAIARFLGLPESFFTEPDLDRLFAAEKDPTQADRIAKLERTVEKLVDAHGHARAQDHQEADEIIAEIDAAEERERSGESAASRDRQAAS